MDFSNRAFICSISCWDGARFTFLPMTLFLISAWPTKKPQLTTIPLLLIFSIASPIGNILLPHTPVIMVVTPCFKKLSLLLSTGLSSVLSRWLCGSMKPGAIMYPVASITLSALKWLQSPTYAIVSAWTRMSPTKHLSVLPLYIVPFLIIILPPSSGVAHAAIDEMANNIPNNKLFAIILV